MGVTEVNSNDGFSVVVLAQKNKAETEKKRKTLPNKFASRRKARAWIKNHQRDFDCQGFLIIHPDLSEELFH